MEIWREAAWRGGGGRGRGRRKKKAEEHLYN
jgi:hypothetical protein